jgi:hypothetical protein
MELLTHHARARMQQRGISAATVEALLDFGREVHVDGGCDLVFFDKRARARLKGSGPESDKRSLTRGSDLPPHLYAIVGSDGTVITVGHRYRRIPRGR